MVPEEWGTRDLPLGFLPPHRNGCLADACIWEGSTGHCEDCLTNLVAIVVVLDMVREWGERIQVILALSQQAC